MGKLGILAIGAVLIIAVLFIGYKMDTSSSRVPSKKAPKKAKPAKAKTKAKREKKEQEIYDNVYNMNYEPDEELFENDNVSQEDLNEVQAYEEDDDDVSLFSSVTEEESTFDNDIDNELSFETSTNDYMMNDTTVQDNYDIPGEVVAPQAPAQEEFVIEPIVDPTVADKMQETVEEEAVEVEEPVAQEPAKKKRGRPKKVVEPEIVEEIPVEEPVKDDFSSTMIFDTDKLTNDLEEIDNMDNAPINTGVDNRLDIFGDFGKSTPEPAPVAETKIPEPIVPEPVATPEPTPVVEELTPEDYSDEVYIEDIDSLDDDMPKAKPSAEFSDGPFKPAENEAESFMNQLKIMQESAEADDFAGFAVDTRSEELKETHKKYTKKKIDTMEESSQISFVEDQKDETSNSGVDMNFLEQMEKNLKETQKERLTKKKKKSDE